MSDRILGGGAAGAHVQDSVMVAAAVEEVLKVVRVAFALLDAITGSDAVAVADDNRLICGEQGQREKDQRRNEKSPPQRRERHCPKPMNSAPEAHVNSVKLCKARNGRPPACVKIEKGWIRRHLG